MIGVGCELNSQNLQKERGAGGVTLSTCHKKAREGVVFVKMRTDLQFSEPFGVELGESESQ